MVQPVWADFVSGSLTSTLPAINAGSTQTMTSDGLVRMPSVVDGVTQGKLTLDPFAAQGDPELVYITSHAAGTNTAVIQRIAGQPLRQHLAAEQWVHAPTAEDFNEFQMQLDNQFHTSIFTEAGQLLGANAVNNPVPVAPGPDWYALTIDTAAATKLRYRRIPFVVTSTTRPTQAAGAYEGMLIYETDSNHVLVNLNPALNGGAGYWVYIDDPPGLITPTALSAPPLGWLWCDGTLYDGTVSTYAALFAAIGQQFGGSGNNFNVPDLKNRFPYGWDPSVAGGQGVANARGYKEGAHSHALNPGNLPAHTHNIASHTHSMVHGHSMASGTKESSQQAPYPIMGIRQDGQPQKLYTQGDGLAVTFTWQDDFNGNTGGSGTLTSGNGPGTQDVIDTTPRLIRLGYMIRR